MLQNINSENFSFHIIHHYWARIISLFYVIFEGQWLAEACESLRVGVGITAAAGTRLAEA